MIKAIFLDFYGTVVDEDGAIIIVISERIYNTGKVNNISEIGSFCWKEFCDLFENSFGNTFQTQRKLEFQSLKKALDYHNLEPQCFVTSEDARSYKPRKEMFEIIIIVIKSSNLFIKKWATILLHAIWQ